MSLYEMVHGRDKFGPLLLGLLSERQGIDVGRYRDAWVEHDGDMLIIRVHTRNGGGNREGYESEIQSMQDHPWFVRDAVDDYDSTYADFYFCVDLEWVVANIDRGDECVRDLIEWAQAPVDVGARWQAAIDALKAL